jgi:GTPase
LILDIFAQRARRFEGKLQVELAQLSHLATRLVRGWTHLERQKGGIGLRGPGETQLETDRRLIAKRIRTLRSRLEKLDRQRDTGRHVRREVPVPTVALVGYTNAGKSTLFNALTGSDSFVADQLFATLDPTVRRLKLPGGRRCTLGDTVGFVSKLPHDLVEAFRSTLEEVSMAELIVHVADASSQDVGGQIEAVRRVLGEIGAGDVAEVLVLNKIDRLSGSERVRLARRYRGSVPVSALTGEGVEGLLATIEDALPHPPVEVTMLVPYGREDLIARLYRNAEVLSIRHDGEGTLVHARVGLRDLAAVREFVRTERRRGA